MSNLVDIPFPLGLFISVPSITTGGGINAGASWIALASATKDDFSFRMMNGMSISELKSAPSFHAIGRWK